MAVECSSCTRPDFASGLRCQWCGTYFQNGSTPTASTLVAPAANGVPSEADFDYGVEAPETHAPVEDKKGDWKAILGKTWGWALALFLLLGKAKGLLVALKMGKFLTTGVSMLVSVAFYAMVFGWKFAVGFVLLIFVHEMGHVLVIKQKGLQASAPIFIPFLGAAIFLKQRPQDPLTDAQISYGGPLIGSLGAAACYLVYMQNGSTLWLLFAHVGFMINLFNLLPTTPLDGGWIVKAIAPKLVLPGAILGVIVGFWIHSVLLVIVAGFAVMSGWRMMQEEKQRAALAEEDDDGEEEEEEPAAVKYEPMAPRARMAVTACYLGLAIALGISVSYTTQQLEYLRENHKLDPNSPAAAFSQPRNR